MTPKTNAGDASARRVYYVSGGEYRSFADRAPIAGTEESYGPFSTREEAKRVWREKAMAKIDNAMHRLRIVRKS